MTHRAEHPFAMPRILKITMTEAVRNENLLVSEKLESPRRKFPKWWKVACVAAMVAFNAAALRGGNFVYNESFETGDGPFVAAYFNTTASNCTWIRQIANSAAQARSGECYMELSGLFGDNNWLFQNNAGSCPVMAGTWYEVSAWIQRTNFDPAYSIQLQVAWYDTNRTYLDFSYKALTGFAGSDTGYTNVSFRALAPANACYGMLKIWMKRNAGPNRTDASMLIDDVSIADYAFTRADIEAVKDTNRWAAGSNLVAQIEAATNNSTINIDPGYYCFSGGFGIYDLNNVIIRQTPNTTGQVNFVFATDRIVNNAIAVVNCSNVVLSDFLIDYYPAVTSQGRVAGWNQSSKSVVIDVDPGFPAPTTNWITSADFGQNDDPKALLFDKNSRLQKSMANDYAVGGAQNPTNAQRFTISLTSVNMFQMGSMGYPPIQTNDILTFARRPHSTFFLKADHVTLSNLTAYASGNALIVSGGGDGAYLISGVSVIRKPDTERMLASCCEAIHMIGDYVAPVITNCVFKHMGDDAINVHTYLSIVADTPATDPSLRARQILVVQKYAGVYAGMEGGGKLSFFGPQNLAVHGRNIGIQRAQELFGVGHLYYGVADEVVANYGNPLLSWSSNSVSVWLVTLDTAVTNTSIARLDFVSPQAQALSGLVLANTVIYDANNNGIVVESLNSRIENNTIEHTGGSGVVFFPYVRWMEGVFANNVLISGNLIKDTVRMAPRTGTRNQGGIVVSALPRYWVSNPSQEVTSRIFEQITVVSNTVVNCGYTPIILKNTTNSVVQFNNIIGALDSPAPVLASLNFSPGGRDEGFNRGLYVNNNEGCVVEGNVFSEMNGYAHYYVGPDNPASTIITNLPGNLVGIGVEGDNISFSVTNNGGSYVVQATTNLANPAGWLPVYTNTAPFTFTETNALNLHTQRFYRTLAQ